MKLLFDQNISHRILKQLPDYLLQGSHVKKEGLINSTDKEIWEFARANGFTIVTQDSDFNDLNSLYGFPPKVVWIRIGNVGTSEIVRVLVEYDQELQKFIADRDYGCFEILKKKSG